MGKNTGFLDYARKENPTVPPLLRTANFKEFHTPLADEERRTQASRCMNCGVPMCQSAIQLGGMVTGCPLHNLIPEWNESICNGHLELAVERLLQTASFPEFTGRVCPALCEKACNCCNGGTGTDTQTAVSIRDNEVFLIEKAFSSGWLKPRIPRIRTDKRIAVIGSGPAGLAVADILNRRGHNVTVYERDDRPGGLLMYGIPNMKLDKSVVERRINLMKAEGVTFVTGADVGNTVPASDITEKFDAVALCCGAKEARPLSVPQSDAEGVLFAVDFLKSVTKSLIDSDLRDKSFVSPEGKHVVVVGGGDTGNDCTGTCIRLGCSSVTQLEMMPQPPERRLPANPWPQWPRIIKTDYGQEEAIARFGSDPRVYETTIKEIIVKDGHVAGVKTVQVEFQMVDGKRQLVERAGTEKVLPADLILVAAGFTGCQKYTANAFGVELSPRNTIATENGGYKTAAEKIFVAGDMHRGQSLVVWAIAEGRECAHQIDRYLMGYTNI